MKKKLHTIVSDKKQEIVFEEKSSGKIEGKPFDLDINKIDEELFHVLSNHQSYNVEIIEADYVSKTLTVKVNSNRYTVKVQDELDELLATMGIDAMADNKISEIKAPMPGLVLEVVAHKDAEVKKGDSILILEAMKMENVLKSPIDGKIKNIKVEKGQAVEKNQLLIEYH